MAKASLEVKTAVVILRSMSWQWTQVHSLAPYPGREKDDGSVHARDMVRGILKGGAAAQYIPTFEEINAYLERTARPNDLVVTVGSGDVYIQTKKLL